MRKTLMFIAGIALFFGGALAVSAAPGPRTGPVPGSDVQVSACVIRFLPTHREPQIHANNSHTCAGVKSVDFAPNGRLRVRQDLTNPAATPILGVVAQVDETLAARGIIVGPSGGTTTTEFQFYDTKLGRPLNLRNTADWNRITSEHSNLWVTWIHLK